MVCQQGFSMMAKNFGFNRGFWRGGAIDVDEGLFRTSAGVKNILCDKPFPAAGSPGDQHGAISRCNLLDLLADIFDGIAFTENALD